MRPISLCFFAVFEYAPVLFSSLQRASFSPLPSRCLFLCSGHSGHATSEFVSKTLFPTVELSLSTLHSGSLLSPFEPVKPRTVRSILADAKSWLFDDSFGGGKKDNWKVPEKVELALKRSFEALDDAIVWDRKFSALAGGKKKSYRADGSFDLVTAVRLLEKLSTSYVPSSSAVSFNAEPALCYQTLRSSRLP